MNSFTVSLSNVLITLVYVLPGFALCRAKKLSGEHLAALSSFLVYACSPCLIVSSFLSLDFSLSALAQMGIFFLITLVLQATFILILALILKKRFGDARFRVLTIGSVMGNVGFFGLPIIRALFPQNPEVLCYSATYTLSMNIIIFTVGVFFLTGKKESVKLKKAFFNPAVAGLAVGLPLYLMGANAFLPSVITDAVSLFGKMSTPICMLILGVRLASVKFGKLFKRPIIYFACLLKLVVFPVFCFAATYFLPLPHTMRAAVVVLSATPCASLLLNLAEMHRGETELAANCVLLSTLTCFISLPLITLLI